MNTNLPNQKMLKYLFGLIIFLAFINFLNVLFGKPLWPLTRHIDLGSDTNMAAWFSSVLLALGGFASLQCAERSKQLLGTSWGFYLLSALIFAMSCDEIARLHETVYGDLAKLIGISGLSFAKHAAWVWVGGPVIAATFIAILLSIRKQVSVVAGAFSKMTLGLALMFLGGVVLESSINFLNQDNLKLIWEIEVIVEESLEMVGSLVLLTALVKWRDADIEIKA